MRKTHRASTERWRVEVKREERRCFVRVLHLVNSKIVAEIKVIITLTCQHHWDPDHDVCNLNLLRTKIWKQSLTISFQDHHCNPDNIDTDCIYLIFLQCMFKMLSKIRTQRPSLKSGWYSLHVVTRDGKTCRYCRYICAIFSGCANIFAN